MLFIRALKVELRRSVLSLPFFAAVAVMAIGLVAGMLENLIQLIKTVAEVGIDGISRWTLGMLISAATASQVVMFVLPICAAIPYTTAFIDDMESGFIKPYLHRVGRIRYLICRSLACVLSSGLAVFLGMALVILLLFLGMQFSAVEPGEVSAAAYFVEPLKVMGLFVVGGMLWSSVGLLASTLTMSRFSALAIPFIVFYLLIILVTQYFPEAYKLNPQYHLMLYAAFEKPLMGVGIDLGVMLAMLAGFCTLSGIRLKKQL